MTNTEQCNHDELEATSVCCGVHNYYGVCGACKEFTGWEKYCPVCDTIVEENVEVEP